MSSMLFLDLAFLNSVVFSDHRHSFPTRRSSDLPNTWRRITGAEGCERGRSPNLDGTALPAAVPLPDPVKELRLEGQFRSEEHTSELQTPCKIVCRHLLAKQKSYTSQATRRTTPR